MEETVNIEDGATLTILPGTDVYIGDNKSIVVRPGAKLISEGTEQEPIYFKRADPSKSWNRISLESSAGNIFRWSLFDGGLRNIYIRSKNNLLEHCTFRNGWKGISSTQNLDGGGNSFVKISHSLIEDNTGGISAYYLNMDLSHSTIQNNGQIGLSILSSTVVPFHHNLIKGNGLPFDRDGISVYSSGALLMWESAYDPGYNEVSGNGEDQISNYGALTVGEYYSGKNSIHGNYSGSRYLVENNSGSRVYAYNTWWGGYPSTGMFTSNVNYSFFEHSDPLNGVTVGANDEVPQKATPRDPSGEVDFVEAYDEAETRLQQAATKQEVRDRLHRLFMLTLFSEDPALTTRFNEMTRNAASGRAHLQSGTEVTKAFQDYAKVLYAKSLIRDSEYKNAQVWLDDFNPEALDGYDRRDWLHLQMVTQTYHGEYETALKTLEDYYAFQLKSLQILRLFPRLPCHLLMVFFQLPSQFLILHCQHSYSK